MVRRSASVASHQYALPLAQSAFVALILAATLTPRDPAPHFVYGQDKAEHVAAFGVLALLMCWRQLGRPFWLAGIFTAALACLVEGLQGVFVPTRVADPIDLVAGFIGVAGTMGFIVAWRQLKKTPSL